MNQQDFNLTVYRVLVIAGLFERGWIRNNNIPEMQFPIRDFDKTPARSPVVRSWKRQHVGRTVFIQIFQIQFMDFFVARDHQPYLGLVTDFLCFLDQPDDIFKPGGFNLAFIFFVDLDIYFHMCNDNIESEAKQPTFSLKSIGISFYNRNNVK